MSEQSVNKTKIDTLVIVGNGFDTWQGLKTTYDDFKKYYLSNRETIVKKLRLPLFKIEDEEGNVQSLSDVEIIYGEPFFPSELPDEFWGDFEYSLSDIDDQRLNLFFGKTRRGLSNMKKSVKNAKRILNTAFFEWIKSITVTNVQQDFIFGDNCIFLNFNYTDTLIKRFGVSEDRIFHPHGRIEDKDIIFGHSSHPETPDKNLYKFGGRFRGLYFVETLLHMTDKQVMDHVREIGMFLSLHGVHPTDIKEVYVLGQAMHPVDLAYFDFLADATINRPARQDKEEQEDDLIVKIRKLEQEQKDEAMDRYFYKLLGIKKSPDILPPVTRKFDATWHITAYSKKDKKWLPIVTKELGINSPIFYPDIPSCLSKFKKS